MILAAILLETRQQVEELGIGGGRELSRTATLILVPKVFLIQLLTSYTTKKIKSTSKRRTTVNLKMDSENEDDFKNKDHLRNKDEDKLIK